VTQDRVENKLNRKRL